MSSNSRENDDELQSVTVSSSDMPGAAAVEVDVGAGTGANEIDELRAEIDLLKARMAVLESCHKSSSTRRYAINTMIEIDDEKIITKALKGFTTRECADPYVY